MFNNRKVVAIIPARGGSKGLLKKNIYPLCGKPLIHYTVITASECNYIDEIIVSTDCDSIKDVVQNYSVSIHNRNSHLSEDNSLVADTLKEILNNYTLDELPYYAFLLEPTCPFRNVTDLQTALELIENSNLDCVASFAEASLNPHRAWTFKENNRPVHFLDNSNGWLPRQSLPQCFQLNGGVYLINVFKFLNSEMNTLLFGNSAGFLMPEERSVDIDNKMDILFAEFILKNKNLIK